MATLSELRARAARLHKNATSKISRLRKDGVDLAGTISDPRRSPELYKRYNRAQLEKRIELLEEFNSRYSTTLVEIGSKGNRVTLAQVQAFKKLEKKANKRKIDIFNKIKDVEIPFLGMTVQQTLNMHGQEKYPQMGESITNFLRRTDKKISNIEDMSKVISRVHEMSNNIIKIANENAMMQIEGMLQVMESANPSEVKEIRDRLTNLSPVRFFILHAGNRHFMDELATPYSEYVAGVKDSARLSTPLDMLDDAKSWDIDDSIQ